MNALHWLSILIEATIALLGLKIVLKKKKAYGWGIFLTFGIYVFYDLAKLFSLNISPDLLYLFFFVATVSALSTVLRLAKGK
jgi:hypothetical protein